MPVSLCRVFGGAEAVFHASRAELDRVSGLSPQRRSLLLAKDLTPAQSVLQTCRRKNIRLLTWQDKEYPHRLRALPDAPVVLYYLGNPALLNTALSLAMVGTREISAYGAQVTRALSQALAQSGAVIVSGCAVGGDSEAHRGALDVGGFTIGVEACGLDVNYPAENVKLRRAIARRGLLLSELPPGTRCMRRYFSTRNRLLSGLSDGVLLTEAHAKSGCLLTARQAARQKRKLFCVPPANILEARYDGMKELLRQGAVPVMDVKDVLDAFSVRPTPLSARKITRPAPPKPAAPKPQAPEQASVSKRPEPSKAPARKKPPLTGLPAQVYQVLEEPAMLDGLAERLNLEPASVLAALTELELLGLCKPVGGGRYQRNS